ncbi:MAG: hypothetical protein ACM3PZ_00920 [Bacillota bacterium]
MNKKASIASNRRRFGTAGILLLLLSATFLAAPQPAHAQVDFNQAINNVLTPIWNFVKKAYEKGGAAALQKATRSALNKIAYDTATYLGSGREGQKPMFVTQDWGDYLAQIGDEAAGEFIEGAVNNWNKSAIDKKNAEKKDVACQQTYDDCVIGCSGLIPELGDQNPGACESDCLNNYKKCKSDAVVSGSLGTVSAGTSSNGYANVCSPSSLQAKLKIAMGLVNEQRPKAPNCTASELVGRWGEAINDLNFLDDFKNIFSPTANDLGIYFTLRTEMMNDVNLKAEQANNKLVADGGWLDMHDIAGNLVGLPGDAELDSEIAKQGYIDNMSQFTGDALIDAANVFLNQLALSAYKNWTTKKIANNPSEGSLAQYSSDPNIQYGEKIVKESAAEIIEPNFSVRADYDILSSLTMCRDRSNPGATDCVIDEKLMQGISEKKTVAEALKEGVLHRDWQVTKDFREGAYNLRNLQIMRKYRIVPMGWEVAAASGREATLGDLVSCYSDSDQYNEYSSSFDVRNQGWCRNLIDPNWVLKAPMNYCAKQGYGAQILDISLVPEAGLDGKMQDRVQITRADNYCADEQSCIKEKEDGSCEAYGYCQSERRTWSFGSKSCSPVNNTCTSFINSTSGQRVAYLENTLDYGDCTADSAGCKIYSVFGTYATSTGTISWSDNEADLMHFNNRLSACSAADEGCKEMMRVKPGWGSNLITGAGFDQDAVGDQMVDGKINNYWTFWSDGTKSGRIIDASEVDANSSGKAILMESLSSTASSSVALHSNNANSLIPANLNNLSEETFTLSADVYLIEGDKVHVVLGSDYQAFSETRDKNVWRHISITRNLSDKPLSEFSFSVNAYSSTNRTQVAVRNLKLEMTPWDSGFSLYGSYKAYEKLIPPYLAASCYINASENNPDFRLKPGAPSICTEFARRCNREEVGCEKYTEKATGFSVAAQAVSSDYCDQGCNGYDLYVARGNYFFSPQADKLIPSSSRKCGAEAAGCAEFTNLDEASAGGESREYYTQLKQCVKPSSECGDFYTWMGSEETGYQLRSLSLKKDASGLPAVTADDSLACSEAIYNLPAGAPGFNPDCRQYYNKQGKIAYHLSASTVTCSENCHPYRLTEKNIDSTLTQAQCTGSGRSWNATAGVCYSCLNGGTWDAGQQSCIYQAIPGEGKRCSAAQNGCREYNGSLGNNTKLVIAQDFNDGVDGWEGNCEDSALSSQEASSNNSRSLFYDRSSNSSGQIVMPKCNNTGNTSWLDRIMGSANAAPLSYIKKVLGERLQSGKAYSVKFTASAASDAQVYAAAMNSRGELAYFNASEGNDTGAYTVPGDGEWRTYELNLPALEHQTDADEALIFVSSADLHLDNLVLTEITDRYYLIKGSSDIPDVCYYDMLDQFRGEDYNLGCSLYKDRANKDHYLRQFSKLCQESAVGCELVVDTAGSDNPRPEIWKDENGNGSCDAGENDCVSVPGDRFFYAIYDNSKRCNGADEGCSRMGESVSSGDAWGDAFKRNNPDDYGQSLCGETDAGCEAWKSASDGSLQYFKNPGSNACVYRTSINPEKPGKAWYKVPVMRCDFNNNGSIDSTAERNGQVCSSASDCAANRPCIVDNTDYECPVSYFKTIGLGGAGQQVPVPSDAAGLCDAVQSGCSEYIDPVSDFSSNVIVNPTHEGNTGWGGDPNGWQVQDVAINPNTLYIFSINAVGSTEPAEEVRLEFPAGVSILGENNVLSATTTMTLAIPQGQRSVRHVFHSRGNSIAKVFRRNGSFEVVLKVALVDYQLEQSLDKSSCNGLYNLDEGCVLFNERTVDGGSGLKALTGGWNAAASQKGKAPQKCTAGNCTANALIKVRPDRVCASWLDCLTYIQDPVTNERTCYALGECNRLGDNNECSNFVSRSATALKGDNPTISKITGYSVVDRYNLAGMKEVGLDTAAHYAFEEASPTLNCRMKGMAGTPCVYDKGLVADSIIDKPSGAPTDYPAEGKAYLRIPSTQEISPHSKLARIVVQPGQDYYLNFLTSTKGSSAAGTVSVSLFENGVLSGEVASSSFLAVNGWERKIVRIDGKLLKRSQKGSQQLSIGLFFGAKTSDDSEAYAYFDDINVEPVLKVADNNYVAKECRLYPGVDAASCTSKNSQVIKNGLLGYCLEHDQVNKNICLLWYPLDQVSASANTGSSLGYKGAYPLNYCTNADGNFNLVEKRMATLAKSMTEEGDHYSYCYYEPGRVKNFCNNNKHDDKEMLKDEADTGNSIKTWCQPEKNSNFDYFLLDTRGWGSREHYCIPYPDRERKLGTNDQPTLQASTNMSYDVSGYQGWYLYNGLSVATTTGALFSENRDPDIRIFEVNHPVADQNQLKQLAGDDPENIFFPACDTFAQTVDAAGYNMAWAGRTSKATIYPLQTPLFFRDASNYSFSDKLNLYGRNRSQIPFGAATFPDGFDIFSSPQVGFLNQASKKINQPAFAGRPYGCDGGGCNNIGYCSLNPDMICIYDNTMSSSTSLINKKTCGGNGTCLPLWKPGTHLKSSADILRNIFITSYTAYQFKNGAYSLTDGWALNATLPACGNASAHSSVYDGDYNAYFCSVIPRISNLKLNGIPLKSDTKIPSPGIYSLSFNSLVDLEQQPLKNITIEWGDGSMQTIVNQDHHPLAENPHRIYHYYKTELSSLDLRIRINDNWESYCCMKNGDAACGSIEGSCPKE